MRQKPGTKRSHGEKIVKDIRRATRKQYSAEEKIRIVLDGLKGEDSIAELCRREGIAQSLYYSWSKEFLEAGKKRLAGDTARAATSTEVKDLRREARDLKEVVAEQVLAELLTLPEEAIFAELSSGTLTALDIPPEIFLGAIATTNTILPTGLADDARRASRVDSQGSDCSVSGRLWKAC